MTTALTNAEIVLHSGLDSPSIQPSQPRLRQLCMLIVIFGMAYGAIMGTYSATSWYRSIQVLYGAIKVPLLLLVTFSLSLPSFFVMNTLLGMRRDFAQAVRALITTQAALTIILASLAPFTAVWYAGFADYNHAKLFNAAMFAIASFSAQLLLRRFYRPLIARDSRHRWMLGLWLAIYIFVGIQMAWVLRPFVGSPLVDPRFFREGAFTNAYEHVLDLVWSVIAR